LSSIDENKIRNKIDSLNEQKLAGIEDIPIRIIKLSKVIITPLLKLNLQ